MGYKPNVVEQAKFDYSPLGKIFSKGLNKDDKKEGLLNRSRNIANKHKKQSEVIKDRNEKPLDTIKKQGEKTVRCK